jgi:uncharacterized membrane protein
MVKSNSITAFTAYSTVKEIIAMSDIISNGIHTVVIFSVHLMNVLAVTVALATALRGFIGWIRRREHVKLDISCGISLMIQFKLIAELLRMIIVQTWSELAIIGAIIAIKAAVSFLIDREIRNEEERIMERRDIKEKPDKDAAE